MITVLFGSYYLINSLTTPALEPITVFTADTTPQHIVLQKDDGEKIVLDEPQSNNQVVPKTAIAKSEKKELDYRQVISTTTQTHVLTVPRGESFKVVLCDGTEVWLNANSNFVYPTAFIGNERIVTLEGEAAHLQSDGNFVLTEVDLDSYVYWKDGYFYFDNITLKDIMQNLGRWYNVNIEFRNKEAMTYKMHFISDRTKDLEHTISLLNRMKKVTVTLQGNTLTID